MQPSSILTGSWGEPASVRRQSGRSWRPCVRAHVFPDGGHGSVNVPRPFVRQSKIGTLGCAVGRIVAELRVLLHETAPPPRDDICSDRDMHFMVAGEVAPVPFAHRLKVRDGRADHHQPLFAKEAAKPRIALGERSARGHIVCMRPGQRSAQLVTIEQHDRVPRPAQFDRKPATNRRLARSWQPRDPDNLPFHRR